MTSPLKLHRDLPVKQNPLSHFEMIGFDVQIWPNTSCDAEHVFCAHWSGNSGLAGNILKRGSGLSESSDEPHGPGSLIPGAFGAAPTPSLLPRAPSTCQGKEHGCSGGKRAGIEPSRQQLSVTAANSFQATQKLLV